MLNIDTSNRSNEPEIMDDFDLKGEELKKTLRDLERINALLGGNRITKNGIKRLLPIRSKKEYLRIVDIGCGNGAILRRIADWGRKEKLKFRLIGLDANSHAIKIAEGLSMDYPEIHYQNLNIFSDEFRQMKFDIILCTLTLHHFKDKEIKKLMHQLCKQAQLGIVINDLHRSRWAYFLFKLFCKAFVNNEIARKDGLISILRGFKKNEIEEYAGLLPYQKHQIQWKWAFRYQWLIEKDN